MSPALAFAGVCVALISTACAARAQRLWSDPPFVETGGTIAAAREDEGGRASVTILAASPHGIEDLSSWRAEARFGAGILESGVSWRRLAHPLYREDRVSALLEARISGIGVVCGVVPVVTLRAIQGFPGGRSIALLASLAWDAGRFVSIRAQVPVRTEGRAAGPGSAVCCRARAGRVCGGVLAHSPDALAVEARFFAAFDLGDAATIESSYAVRAREVSGAFAAGRRGFRASVAWSVNASLGVTFSAEVGRRWSW